MQPLCPSATPSFHSPHQPQRLSRTSTRPPPIPAPPALHDNGTGSSPGNRPFISCVIKKMYSPPSHSPSTFSHLCFSAEPVDERQRERAVPALSRSLTHWFCKSFSRGIPLESWGNRLGALFICVQASSTQLSIQTLHCFLFSDL